jgi:hypothetical protein
MFGFALPLPPPGFSISEMPGLLFLIFFLPNAIKELLFSALKIRI